MKKYSANYTFTNHNFVIQNLHGNRIDNVYLPAICILKNLLQRGKPTIMSKYLQGIYGSLHQEADFKKPYVLISQNRLNWIDTIKGDFKNNYFPARTFLEKRIDEDLPDYKYIRQLILPEAAINEITQIADERFNHQCVDFYLPQANLVIEIDGQQHKLDPNRIVDTVRDNHLALHNVLTIRIDTKDLEVRNLTYYSKIDQIKSRLDTYARFLNLYSQNFFSDQTEITEEIKQKKLVPTAILRFQVLILELIENGHFGLADATWDFELKLKDINGFQEHAVEDLFIWLGNILKLQKIKFRAPVCKINVVTQFSKNRNIKVDFSLLERWTDEYLLKKEVIYLRTDYQDLYFNKTKGKIDRVNYFRLSTTLPFKYNLKFNEDENDLEVLKFFLNNLFEYKSFYDGQVPIIQNALELKDTVGLLPTGGGKSLTYQLACLLQPCISFVVCPIKSLMYDQVKDLENAYVQNVELITSDVVGAAREEILDNYGNGKYFFVFISPERFQTKDFRERLATVNKQFHFSYAVIDEVHCLSEWGHDFRTSYLNLSNTINKYCTDIKFLGLTATASVNVLKDIQIEFNIEQENVKTLIDYTRPELEFVVVKDNGDKYSELQDIIERHNEEQGVLELEAKDPNCGLIFTPFVNGKYGCFDLSQLLTTDFKVPVKFYSGSKPRLYNDPLEFEKYKIKVQDEFKQNKFSILAATKAFGMGINKNNIRFTVHYGLPASMESLYQEAGRAGRDKRNANCYILLSPEKNETDLANLFSPEVSYEQIKALADGVGWDGQDVFRQIFLYQNGLESISTELDLLVMLHREFSHPGSVRTVSANILGSNKARVEKAIYRLSNLGIVDDWTVEDFFGGLFTVSYSHYSDQSIKNTLLSFIRKYTDDFTFDHSPERKKYSDIYHDETADEFTKYAHVLLQWSYDKFGANRRESLKNVYYNCLSYDESPEGRENFKRSLEAYFKFTEATYILQHIAENNNKEIARWFEVFYDKKKNFIGHSALTDLEGNLQRFLESYQSNTGLNLINGLTLLLLNKPFVSGQELRFARSFQTVNEYSYEDFHYIVGQILVISKHLNQRGKDIILKYLYQYCKSDDERLRYAKELGDELTVVDHYNKRLQIINNTLANGFR